MTAAAGTIEMSYTHEPVLLEECLAHLLTDPEGTYLDATVGLGGHSEGLLKALGPAGRVIGTDMDPEALESAAERLKPFAGRFTLIRTNFRNLRQVLEGENVPPLAGALFDLGVSSLQLDKASRGFAFSQEGPLDMRLDPSSPLTAASIVNRWPMEQLALLLREYGEERHAARIARLIVTERAKKPFETTRELAELLEARLPRGGGIHPATRTFMALRIAVNQELENLTRGLEAILPFLQPGGRLGVISFHSLEDRIVKNVFRSLAEHGQCVPVGPSPVRPGPEELQRNPRSRSAKLRVVEKKP